MGVKVPDRMNGEVYASLGIPKWKGEGSRELRLTKGVPTGNRDA